MLTLTADSPWARHCSKLFICINLFNLHNNFMSKCYFYPFPTWYLRPELFFFFFLEASEDREPRKILHSETAWGSSCLREELVCQQSLLSKRKVAAVDPFIKSAFSKDLILARHLAELRGLKDSVNPCPQGVCSVGTKRSLATSFKLLPWVRNSDQGLNTQGHCLLLTTFTKVGIITPEVKLGEISIHI